MMATVTKMHGDASIDHLSFHDVHQYEFQIRIHDSQEGVTWNVQLTRDEEWMLLNALIARIKTTFEKRLEDARGKFGRAKAG